MLIDLIVSLYIAAKFLFRGQRFEDRPTVVFARGAFRRDIPSLAHRTDLIVLHGEWLRRLLRQRVPDIWLEQVITLERRTELRAAFPLSVKVFSHFVKRRPTRIIFGGVDYFEIALFADRSFFADHTRIDAVFHENYAIDYVANLNMALYGTVAAPFLFDQLYTYGPPATRILARYTLEPAGPRKMVMPRLARMQNDADFTARIAALKNEAFARTAMLLAFPGTEYLAPICFSATLGRLAESAAAGRLNAIVKFKSPRSAKPYMRQSGWLKRHLAWKSDGSVEELVWQSGFTIVFNSISLYEALLGPTIIIIPNYLDSQHDENLLQESERTLTGMRSVRLAHSLEDIERIMQDFPSTEAIVAAVAAERELRKAFVSRKFYLESDLSPRS